MRPFDKILIANRGEIACRVMRTARALGYRTVAVYSEADAGAPHVAAADQAVAIGPAPAAQSYLSIERILGAARLTGAGAVHPGYGFLAENADFAAACSSAGLTFIGPPPEAIRLMGNKRLSKLKLGQAGIEVIPGYSGKAQSDKRLKAEAAALGAPLMVKAAAGGGGRGLRLVRELDELPQALRATRSEARNAFGSDELILEKALEGARHVEIQVFADGHGNALHLGERDCSVQRRHQKVIEEAPSPALTPELRRRMGEAAVAVVRAIDYLGAGTVEFLLTPEGEFYFLEMNTRLQVEHPVTELVTGLDLVAWQLRIAAGEPLPLAQDQVRLEGHAIEARLYAEDPERGFLPQSGRVLAWEPAVGAGVRVDHGLAAGLEVSPYYDPLLAKIVAYGENREAARRRLARALDDTLILGLTTNKRFLGWVLDHPAFAAGEATTTFVEQSYPGGEEGGREDGAAPDTVAALAAVLLIEHGVEALDPWNSSGGLGWPIALSSRDREIEATVSPRGKGYDVDLGQAMVALSILEKGDGRVRFESGGVTSGARFVIADGVLWADWGGHVERFEERRPGGAGRVEAGDGRLLAPMDGRIVAVLAAPGDAVEKGQCVVVLEAMKIEHEVRAGVSGTVRQMAVAEGDQVAARALLVELEPEGAEAG
jgi:geranyl-CoA carboxylase alpha subunit